MPFSKFNYNFAVEILSQSLIVNGTSHVEQKSITDLKKTLLISLLALLGIIQAAAQESDYLQIVRQGVKWVNEKVIVAHGDTTCYYYNEFCGYDAGLNNKLNEKYRAFYYYTGDGFGDVNGDIKVNIADVNAIISMNLSNK